MSSQIQLNSIEEAIADIRAGKVIIVVDDEDRENEGDFICAAETVTPDIINFMAMHGRGLICTPLEEKRADELGLDLMVGRKTQRFCATGPYFSLARQNGRRSAQGRPYGSGC